MQTGNSISIFCCRKAALPNLWKEPMTTDPQVYQQALAQLARAVAGQDPDLTDQTLAAQLRLLLGSKPRPIWKDNVNVADWEGTISGFQMPHMDQATRSRALALVESSLAPMNGKKECFALLGELKLLTKARAEDLHDQEAQLRLYARKLTEYPADIVRKVLTTQPSIMPWWPAWCELQARLEKDLNLRRSLLEALRPSSPVASGTSAPASAAIDERFRATHGMTIAEAKAEWRRRRGLDGPPKDRGEDIDAAKGAITIYAPGFELKTK